MSTATDLSVLDLPIATTITDDDYIFSIVSSKATRLKWSSLIKNVNAWDGITDKPFDSYDDTYFTVKSNDDGTKSISLLASVYQQLHTHENADILNALNVYKDELYYGDSQIMLDLTYDKLIGKPYDSMSNDFTIAEISNSDTSSTTKQLQLAKTVQDKLHTHENKETIDKFGINTDGKLTWDNTVVGSDYTLPIASTSTLGGVKPDGTTITVDDDGTIHGASQGLDFTALSTAMTTGTLSGISITADTENSRFNFEVTGIPTIAIDSEGYWTINGERGSNPTKAQGNDGFSPIANISQTNTGATITVIDSSGTTTTDIINGTDGITPHIDETSKHWFVGETDTGIVAEGVTTISTTSVTYTGTLSIDGWIGDTAPYTQDVTISGITSDLSPFIDLIVSDDITTSDEEITQWSYITKATTGDNIITFRCNKTKPTIELNFKVKVV